MAQGPARGGHSTPSNQNWGGLDPTHWRASCQAGLTYGVAPQSLISGLIEPPEEASGRAQAFVSGVDGFYSQGPQRGGQSPERGAQSLWSNQVQFRLFDPRGTGSRDLTTIAFFTCGTSFSAAVEGGACTELRVTGLQSLGYSKCAQIYAMPAAGNGSV